MTVTPIPDEPGRFHVSSETDALPWLVDLKVTFGEPRCACSIEYSRTPQNWNCKHIKAAIAFAEQYIRAVRERNTPNQD